MSIINEIPELIKAGIINQETATKIERFYHRKSDRSQNRLFTIFAIIGAILMGLGIILILAHNWDRIPKLGKTAIAFIPLLISQGLCAFARFRKPGEIAWKESTATLLFFSLGICISLIGQVYQISGNLASLLFTWMLLSLPLIYYMRSSTASLLYLAGITAFVWHAGYGGKNQENPLHYWIFLAAIVPYYYFLLKSSPRSNFLVFHNWLAPVSLTIAIGSLGSQAAYLLWPTFMSLFGAFYLVGSLKFFSEQKLKNNGFLICGAIGTMGMLLFLTFDWAWNQLSLSQLNNISLNTPELIAFALCTLCGLLLFAFKRNKSGWKDMRPMEPVFIIFAIIFSLRTFPHLPLVSTNLLVLSLGVMTILRGARLDHLGFLNYGLLIVATLITCRFFDQDLSFVVRGVLFIAVGVGFFLANYLMIKKRAQNV